MKGYELGPPENFLGLEDEHSGYERSRALVLPIPYEATVSYGTGTRNGPRAILEASRQVELYDREFGDEPALAYGIHTLPALAANVASPEAMVDAITAYALEHLRPGKLLFGLGGEHTVSAGLARAVREVYGDFVMVQIDAHSDLRDEFEGSRFSHACVARRVLELGAEVVQLGIRAISREEAELIGEERGRLKVFFGEELRAGDGYLEELAARVSGKQIFLTIDVDGLDPAIMGATGTPVPGGLSWWQALDVVRTVARAGTVVAADCVELAPQPGQHACDFVAAQLVYKAMSYMLFAAKP
jgi:agmatinase